MKSTVIAGLAFALVGCQSNVQTSAPVAVAIDKSDKAVVCTVAADDAPNVTCQASAAEPARFSTAAANQVTKLDVIGWTARCVRDDVIIDRISHADTIASVSAADENELRDAHVSEEVIRALKDAGNREAK